MSTIKVNIGGLDAYISCLVPHSSYTLRCVDVGINILEIKSSSFDAARNKAAWIINAKLIGTAYNLEKAGYMDSMINSALKKTTRDS